MKFLGDSKKEYGSDSYVSCSFEDDFRSLFPRFVERSMFSNVVKFPYFSPTLSNFYTKKEYSKILILLYIHSTHQVVHPHKFSKLCCNPFYVKK